MTRLDDVRFWLNMARLRLAAKLIGKSGFMVNVSVVHGEIYLPRGSGLLGDCKLVDCDLWKGDALILSRDLDEMPSIAPATTT